MSANKVFLIFSSRNIGGRARHSVRAAAWQVPRGARGGGRPTPSNSRSLPVLRGYGPQRIFFWPLSSLNGKQIDDIRVGDGVLHIVGNSTPHFLENPGHQRRRSAERDMRAELQ